MPPNSLDLRYQYNSGAEHDPTEVSLYMQVYLSIVLCVGSPPGFELERFLPVFMYLGFSVI